jgi:transposase-like protein
MGRKRRALSAAFKAKVAMAAAKEDKTLAQLASQFQLHANQVSAWKKLLVERAAELFEDGRVKASEGPTLEELYAQIGRLQIELEFLKKKRDGVG